MQKDVIYGGGGALGRFVKKELEAKGIIVTGVIDKDVSKGLLQPDVLTKDDAVIIASVKCLEIISELKQLKIENYAYYEEVALSNELPVYGDSYKELWKDFDEHFEQYKKIFERFNDKTSKEILLLILSYRNSFDKSLLECARKLSLESGEQYFDNKVLEKIKSNTVFFDIGGEKGTSTYDFYEKIGGVGNKCFFFEPNASNIEFAKNKLHEFKNIYYYNKAVGEDEGKVGFEIVEGKPGSGSVLEEDGQNIVDIVKLDNFSCADAYVKMDVEGYELQVVKGMKSFISNYHPILAICVYHKANDIWNLTSEILRFYPKYNLVLRHYGDFYTETVMYFLPPEKRL